MFNMENTDGFTDSDLEILNAALEIRISRGEDEEAASDAINNSWIDNATVDDLV